MTAAQLASGNLRKVCSCGSVIVWRIPQIEPECAFYPPIEDSPAPVPPQTEQDARPPEGAPTPSEPAGAPASSQHYIYLLELVCLLCGRPVGTVPSETALPATRTFVPAAMRCVHCGGPPIFSGDVGRVIGSRVQFEPLRRGRPSKELVDARRLGLAPPSISAWKKSLAAVS